MMAHARSGVSTSASAVRPRRRPRRCRRRRPRRRRRAPRRRRQAPRPPRLRSVACSSPARPSAATGCAKILNGRSTHSTRARRSSRSSTSSRGWAAIQTAATRFSSSCTGPSSRARRRGRASCGSRAATPCSGCRGRQWRGTRRLMRRTQAAFGGGCGAPAVAPRCSMAAPMLIGGTPWAPVASMVEAFPALTQESLSARPSSTCTHLARLSHRRRRAPRCRRPRHRHRRRRRRRHRAPRCRR